MTNPGLTPRLEQIRVLLQLIRGNETANIALLLQELADFHDLAANWYPWLQFIKNDIASGVYSNGGPGEPASGTIWPSALYARLGEFLTAYQTATAEQLAADGQTVIFMQRLAAIDDKVENLLAQLPEWLESSVTGDSVGQTSGQILGVVQEINAKLTTIDARMSTQSGYLADMLVALEAIQNCICEGGTTPPPFRPHPQFTCGDYPHRFQIQLTNWVVDAYSSVIPFIRGDVVRETNNNDGTTFEVGMSGLNSGDWVGFYTTVEPRTVCFTWNNEPGMNGATISMFRRLGPANQNPTFFWPDMLEVFQFQMFGQTGSTTFDIVEESPGEGQRFYYYFGLEGGPGTNVSQVSNDTSLWIDTGPVG